ncbi:urease accessory protein UreD [Candidatus Spongiihabitans sp.]|uniref:urease accessory protein UreD n=1 Tax=Candidatus Spongiihabitans sp. TaxID=3101308 RepID=UPI003C7EADF0
MLAANLQTQSNWQAELRLQFGCDEGRTVLRSRRSRGPLVVQKPLYPEGDSVCHIYLIHPPGGVVGGDSLQLEMVLEARAKVLLTTPGATKFYRSAGAAATQRQSLTIGADAALEWLPQDTILFSGSQVEMATTVQLEKTARFIGWDMTCLGLPASGDRYTSGSLDQQYQILRGAEPLLIERNRYLPKHNLSHNPAHDPSHDLLQAQWGLAGNTVVATLYAVPATTAMLGLVRDNLSPREGVRCASTCLNDVLVFRCAGRSAEQCRELLVQVWKLLRQPVLQRAVCVPRIWNT